MSLIRLVKKYVHSHSFSQRCYIQVIEKKNRIKKRHILKSLKAIIGYPLTKEKPKTTLEQARCNMMEYHQLPEKCTSISLNQLLEIQYDLQIIVPCYNVEPYIEKCIESILSQETKILYHVVFVDDGSTDKTPIILDKYSSYPQFTVIHLKNGGSSIARNAGIAKLYGRYIMYIDGDDFLYPKAIDNLMKPALYHNYDIVEGGFACIVEGKDAYGFSYKKSKTIDPEKLQGYPWGKVYKRELWEKFKFPIGLRHQDTIGSFMIYPAAKKAYAIKDVVYGYTQNFTGISKTSFNNPAVVDTYWITDCLDKDRQQLGYKNNRKYYTKLMRQFEINHNRLKYAPDNLKESLFVLERDLLLSRYKHIRSFKCIGLSLAFFLNDYKKYCYYFDKLFNPVW